MPSRPASTKNCWPICVGYDAGFGESAPQCVNVPRCDTRGEGSAAGRQMARDRPRPGRLQDFDLGIADGDDDAVGPQRRNPVASLFPRIQQHGPTICHSRSIMRGDHDTIDTAQHDHSPRSV